MKLLVFLFVSYGLVNSQPPSVTKQYRTDYVYNKKTDAFYKLHIEAKNFAQAQSVCKVEGGDLMVPATHFDIVQLHGMFKRFPDLGNYVWVGQDGKEHDSVEEHPLIDLSPSTEGYMPRGHWDYRYDVVNRNGEIETYPYYHSLPFICKVDASEAPYDRQCHVYGNGYSYFESVGSCYKIPRIVFSWNQAYAECRAEGAHLVVINSEAEMLVVKNITNTVQPVLGATTSWFFFAGFRGEPIKENQPRVFKTIFNQTLEDAGYSQWSPNEPNNYRSSEDCGTVFKNDGKFNDVDCSHEYAFICEKEVAKH